MRIDGSLLRPNPALRTSANHSRRARLFAAAAYLGPRVLPAACVTVTPPWERNGERSSAAPHTPESRDALGRRACAPPSVPPGSPRRCSRHGLVSRRSVRVRVATRRRRASRPSRGHERRVPRALLLPRQGRAASAADPGRAATVPPARDHVRPGRDRRSRGARTWRVHRPRPGRDRRHHARSVRVS